MSGCGFRSPVPSFGRVTTGADEVVASEFSAFRGLRVGLIVNQTSTAGGRHVIDLFHERPDVRVTALFGPEHGIRGNAGAGESVRNGIDSVTGAPVYSLYGAERRPTPEMLADVDALVFDIQDVGARFYTYISTMGLAMQSAAECGIPFYVLDRPNPLGGEMVAGFVRDAGHESFVGQYPIPVMHGLSVGELARMIQGERWLPGLERLDLHVVEMSGWDRSLLWTDTGLEWIPTSPNIPTFETALVYPGMCLFEASSASEGRGTPAPFLTVGAPWLDAERIVRSLPSKAGILLKTGTVIPQSIPGVAPNPKWEGVPLQTIEIHVTNPKKVQPFDLGVDLLLALRNAAPDSVRVSFLNKNSLGRLSGSDRLLQLIESGATGEEIHAAWRQETDSFRRLRERWLLYD